MCYKFTSKANADWFKEIMGTIPGVLVNVPTPPNDPKHVKLSFNQSRWSQQGIDNAAQEIDPNVVII